MKTKELKELLEQFDDDSTVTLVFNNGEGVEVAEVERLCPNAGPSLYAVGWDEETGR